MNPSTLLAAVQPETGWGFPRDVSVEGHRIDWLINVTAVFCTIMFVIMVAWILLAVLKHGKSHTAQYDHGNAKKQITMALGLSALIFVVVDGNLFYNSVVDLDEAFWNFDDAEEHPEVVRIEVNAHQWAWDVRHPGVDGKFTTPDDILTTNEMTIPVGRPILIEFGAVDVIHSFYLPNLRVKTDAVPGNITKVVFTAKHTGDFDIACAQHCGVHHYKMKGLLRIVGTGAYESWVKEASANAERAYDPADTDAHWGWEWEKL